MCVLLRFGADVNLADDDGDTPLIMACRSGKSRMVKRLLVGGADMNQKNVGGKKALDCAMECHNYKAVKHLEDWAAKIKEGTRLPYFKFAKRTRT